MTKSKNRTLEDRLSELPDSLILHILERLPTIDVIRTTILSNRWKNLWTTIRCLTFNHSVFDNIDRLIGFVNGVIKFWRGNKIIRFRFWAYSKINKSAFSDIDSWVRFAKENEVEELDLSIKEEDYWLLQYLYSCSSLKKLSLEGCNFEIHEEVLWNRLKCLEIRDVCLDENVVNKILLGSPQLEDLFISVRESDDSLSICSTSLKELMIEKFVSKYIYLSMDSELRIWAPNLKKLRMWGVPHTRYLLQNVSSLTLAALEFHGPSYHGYDSSSWYGFLGERLREIFPAIQHVEKVTLSDWSIQVLGAAVGTSLLSPCPNVKILKLTGCLEEYEQIFGLLETFPNLARLILEAEKYLQPVRADDAKSFLDLEFQTSSVLSKLRIVKVSWINGDTSFYRLIELVLKHASQLEKVVFRKRLDYMTFDVEVLSFCITRACCPSYQNPHQNAELMIFMNTDNIQIGK